MGLPQFQDGPNSFQLMQNAWAKLLNPLLKHSPTTNRQVVIGTPNVSALTLPSTTFADFSAPKITLAFTADASAKYKVSCSFIGQGDTSSTRCAVRLNGSTGTPATVLFEQTAVFDVSAGIVNTPTTLLVYQIVTLKAGTQYTFTLQGKASSGSIVSRADLASSGVAIIAEQLT